MTFNKRILSSALITTMLLVLAVGGLLTYVCEDDWCGILPWSNMEVTSYEQCVEQGNPVLESYPRQCLANGRTFVEQLNNPPVSRSVDVQSPEPNAVIKSPLHIVGRARGQWYFEASFPITIIDAEGTVLGTGIAQALDEWMTTNFVPFKADFSFDKATTSTGTIIFHKDNPSGLPENDDSVRFPVRF